MQINGYPVIGIGNEGVYPIDQNYSSNVLPPGKEAHSFEDLAKQAVHHKVAASLGANQSFITGSAGDQQINLLLGQIRQLEAENEALKNNVNAQNSLPENLVSPEVSAETLGTSSTAAKKK
jgi:hypothetical protein